MQYLPRHLVSSPPIETIEIDGVPFGRHFRPEGAHFAPAPFVATPSAVATLPRHATPAQLQPKKINTPVVHAPTARQQSVRPKPHPTPRTRPTTPAFRPAARQVPPRPTPTPQKFDDVFKNVITSAERPSPQNIFELSRFEKMRIGGALLAVTAFLGFTFAIPTALSAHTSSSPDTELAAQSSPITTPPTLAPTTTAIRVTTTTQAPASTTTVAPVTTTSTTVRKPTATTALVKAATSYASCSSSKAAAEACWGGLIDQYSWNHQAALNVMWCESRGNPNARNAHSTATGLFQVLGGSTDPVANVRQAGAMYAARGWQPWVCKP